MLVQRGFDYIHLFFYGDFSRYAYKFKDFIDYIFFLWYNVKRVKSIK